MIQERGCNAHAKLGPVQSRRNGSDCESTCTCNYARHGRRERLIDGYDFVLFDALKFIPLIEIVAGYVLCVGNEWHKYCAFMHATCHGTRELLCQIHGLSWACLRSFATSSAVGACLAGSVIRVTLPRVSLLAGQFITRPCRYFIL